MRNYNYILLAGVALFAFSACNKENNLEDSAQVNGPVYETVGVKLGVESKVTLSGGGAKSAFEEGDKIAVWTEAGNFQTCAVDGSGKITVDISGGVRSNYAVYYNGATAPTYDGTLSITLPASYNLVDVSGTKNPVPMVAKNVSGDANDMVFYAVGGLFRLTVNSIPDDATGLLVDFHGHKVSGAFAVSNPGTTTPSIATTSDNTNDKITVTFVAGTTGGSATINLPLPTGGYTDISVTPISSVTKVSSTRHISGASYTAQRAHGKQLTSTLVSFTVDELGTKAVIAPGNLNAVIGSYNDVTKIATASSWSFAENQYVSYNNLSFAEDDIVDRFKWVSASASYDTYGLINLSFSGANTPYYGHYTSESLKSDWGSALIGSYEPGDWVTPSHSEVDYLLDTRTVSNTLQDGGRYVFGKILGVGAKGIFLFPDNYVHPDGTGFSLLPNDGNPQWNTCSNFFANVGLDGWALMEAAGVVFIPIINTSDNYGDYWTGTKSDSNVALAHRRAFYFWGWINNTENVGGARAVRLIRKIG